MFLLLSMIFFWVVVATVIGYWVGVGKGRPTEGALLGLFLGWVGVVITAVKPATEEKQRTDALKQADIIKSALNGSISTASTQPAITREHVLTEVLNRHPELKGKTDPDTLAQIAVLSDQIQSELELKAELQSLQEREDKEAKEALREQKRRELEQEQRAQDEQRYQRERERRAEDHLKDSQRVQAMSPIRRFITVHRTQAIIGAGIAITILAIAIAGVAGARNRSAEQERLYAEQGTLNVQLTEDESKELINGLQLNEAKYQGPGNIGNKPLFTRQTAVLSDGTDKKQITKVTTKPTGCGFSQISTIADSNGTILNTTVRRWTGSHYGLAVSIYDLTSTDDATKAMSTWQSYPQRCRVYIQTSHWARVPGSHPAEDFKDRVIQNITYPTSHQIRMVTSSQGFLFDGSGMVDFKDISLTSVDQAENRIVMVHEWGMGGELSTTQVNELNTFATAAINKALADKGGSAPSGPIWNLG